MTDTTPRSPELISQLRRRADRMRVECLQSTTTAGSGHPTTCMSAADVMSALFFGVMRYDPKRPDHPANDRFVLSKGHAAPLLYAAWAEAGAIPFSELQTLRRIDSELEGHPTWRFAWSEAATGSLGQGLPIGAGMAIASKYLEKAPYRVFVMMGDGECAEGSIWEAANFASYHKLDNLIGIVDVNGLGQSQRTMFDHQVAQYARRFEGFGWRTYPVDGHDMGAILDALEAATHQAGEGRPAVILARTLKGKGVSFLEDKEGWHGKPLDKEQLAKALAELPPPGDPIPFKPNLPPAFTPVLHGEAGTIEPPAYEKGKLVATREAYGDALVKLGKADPFVVAIDGDTKNSTFSEKFMKAFPGRFFEGFIAEQNMAGAAVGLSRRGFNPFVSTFACFLARAFDFARMAPIGKAKVRFCGSHCGVSIGEDGPSQMGLEDIAMFRAVAGSIVLYPSDAVSAEKLVEAAARHDGVAYVRTSRPKTPVLYDNTEPFPVGGSKTLRSSDRDQVTIVGAGVTLHEALKACDMLAKEGILARVVDCYSVKPIDAKGLARHVSETGGKVIVVEDHFEAGGIGEAVATCLDGMLVKLTRLCVKGISRSGKPEELLEMHGISARAIAAAARKIVSAAQAPS